MLKPLTTPAEWAWMKDRTHMIACEDSQGVMAYDSKGIIIAGCVADSFTVDGCNVHLGIDKPLVLRGPFLNEIARHLFIVCDRSKLFALVPANNEKALKFDKHVGFREVARVADGYKDGIDYVVLRIDREGCRWLNTLKEAA